MISSARRLTHATLLAGCLMLAFSASAIASAPVVPVANDDLGESTMEDHAVDINVLSNDAHSDQGTVTVVTQPTAHGDVDAGTTTIVENRVRFVPAANFTGLATFQYTLTDDGMLPPALAARLAAAAAAPSDTATVQVYVFAVNDAPKAEAGTLALPQDGSTTIDLATLVSDPEDPDADLLYTVDTPPAHGTLTGTGATRTYTPTAGYHGADSFSFHATDQGGDCRRIRECFLKPRKVQGEEQEAQPKGGLDSNVATVSIDVQAPAPAGNGGGPAPTATATATAARDGVAPAIFMRKLMTGDRFLVHVSEQANVTAAVTITASQARALGIDTNGAVTLAKVSGTGKGTLKLQFQLTKAGALALAKGPGTGVWGDFSLTAADAQGNASTVDRRIRLRVRRSVLAAG